MEFFVRVNYPIVVIHLKYAQGRVLEKLLRSALLKMSLRFCAAPFGYVLREDEFRCPAVKLQSVPGNLNVKDGAIFPPVPPPA